MARLKKGSTAAKAWGARMKRLREKPKSKRKYSKPIKYKKRKVAKRKRVTRRRSKSASIWGINTGKAAAAALYGAGRARTSVLIQPYTSKIPAGAVSDEVGMIVLAQLLKKMVFKKAGIAREALTAGQAIEFARIGEAVSTGQINLGGLSPQANNGNLF